MMLNRTKLEATAMEMTTTQSPLIQPASAPTTATISPNSEWFARASPVNTAVRGRRENARRRPM